MKFHGCEIVIIFIYLLFLVIEIPDQNKTINCKSKIKNSVCNKWYNFYYNSLEKLNQYNDELTKTFSSVIFQRFQIQLPPRMFPVGEFLVGVFAQ